ncbi:MAG: sirohydrochlorin cobaltochelatase [Lachnospiraceae bacterium]|nr:sirohydrochlorin cobaltochelatase [Lachnospiraceae bacterium]
MKKTLGIAMAAVLGVCCLAGCSTAAKEETTAAVETTTAAETTVAEIEKKDDAAILVVSFGTSYNDNRDLSIGGIEAAFENAFPEYEIRRAFTSQIIIDVLKDRDGLEIDNVTEALDRAAADGIKELMVQPTHLMNGFEYKDLAKELTEYVDQFDKIILAEPLLMDDADFEVVADAITEKTASYDDGKTAICFMGHGTEDEANAVYGKMQEKLTAAGFENYYVGTVESEPTLNDVVAALKAKGTYENVVLEPLMVVAGDHANNDMAGDEEDSWKTILTNEGYKVECVLEGLGQIPAIQELYTTHMADAMKADVAFTGVEMTADETETTVAEPDAVVSNNTAGVLADGTYAIEVESSSAMFKIEKAELTVANGAMSAVITMSGTGYTKLFMGTGEEAAAAAEADYIVYAEDAEGAYTFTIPVTELDAPIDCAAFSKKKEEWYDRQLTFKAATAASGAQAEVTETEAEASEAAAEPVVMAAIVDGTYEIGVTLNGGSGKSTVVSPAVITVKDGAAVATIQWTSPNYDYMIVDGEKYLQTNTEGDSVFEIPVLVFDIEMPVIANTVAMSKPHEIEYTMIFDSASMKAAE